MEISLTHLPRMHLALECSLSVLVLEVVSVASIGNQYVDCVYDRVDNVDILVTTYSVHVCFNYIVDILLSCNYIYIYIRMSVLLVFL